MSTDPLVALSCARVFIRYGDSLLLTWPKSVIRERNLAAKSVIAHCARLLKLEGLLQTFSLMHNGVVIGFDAHISHLLDETEEDVEFSLISSKDDNTRMHTISNDQVAPISQSAIVVQPVLPAPLLPPVFDCNWLLCLRFVVVPPHNLSTDERLHPPFQTSLEGQDNLSTDEHSHPAFEKSLARRDNLSTDEHLHRAFQRSLNLSDEDVLYLRELRHTYEVTIKDSDISGEHKTLKALQLFTQLWEFFHVLGNASMPHKRDHPLYLPPIYYDNEALRDIMHNFCRAMRIRELTPGVFETGHIVLSGVEGTGKSTLLKAFALAMTVCSPTVFPLFFNYGLQGNAATRLRSAVAEHLCTPYALFKELYIRISTQNVSGTFGSMRLEEWDGNAYSSEAFWHARLRSDFNLCVSLLADEFHVVLQGTHSSLQTRKRIVEGFQYVARNLPKSLLVLTGSSVFLRNRLLGLDTACVSAGFLPFNRSLCTYFTVPALKTTEQVRDYCIKRYGACSIDPKLLLSLTGGVGRRIHDIMTLADGTFVDHTAASRKQALMAEIHRADSSILAVGPYSAARVLCYLRRAHVGKPAASPSAHAA